MAIHICCVTPYSLWLCPQRIQSIVDDHESAIHVLTWLALALAALRYIKQDKLDNLHTYLTIYDQVDCHQSKGIATGGRPKGTNSPTNFQHDPLNRLLSILRKTFSARYRETYPDDETQETKDLVAQAKATLLWTLPYTISSRHISTYLAWNPS